MRTFILKDLHNRSILELELINLCNKAIDSNERRIEAEEKKSNLERYLFTSRGEYEQRIQKLELMNERVKRWYFETNHKIKILQKPLQK